MLFQLLLAAMLAHEACPMPTNNPAQPCDQSACQLPDCRCASTDVPGGLSSSEVPQIVTIGFDDALRTYDYDTFYKPVFANRQNPNGCPIGITYFVSHHYTDYALMEHVYAEDHAEIADHSVTHQTPTTWWTSATEQQLRDEINDQRKIMEQWGGIPGGKITGFRVPFLATSENEVKVLHENSFTYEASMSTPELYWPFTLDYKSPICNSPATCPAKSYPGLWLVPVNPLKQSNGFRCAMLDACNVPQSKQEWVDLLLDNFNAHYQTNRSPFNIYSHAAWFFHPGDRANALREFLDQIQALGDVYVVTHSQMIDWVRNPVPSSAAVDFEPWKCLSRPPPRCNYQAPTCHMTFNPQILKSCSSCPNKYPTLGNPQGN